MSPSASTAFGLGSGAFASFGSAKTPKTPGNPFEQALGAAAKTPTAEKSAKEGGLSKPAAGKPSNSALAEPKAGASGPGTRGSASANSHPLRHSWVFWFRPPISKANGYIEYEKTLHPMATCETVEEFFEIYRHLNRPSTLPLVSDYHMFKKGVRPIWEDEENKKGGKWIVRLKKGVADRYWEDLLLALIGDQFFEASDEVCGAVLSVRNGEDILSIWTRTDGGRVLKIRYVAGAGHLSRTTPCTDHDSQGNHEAHPLVPAGHQGRMEEPRLEHPAADGHRGRPPGEGERPAGPEQAAKPRSEPPRRRPQAGHGTYVICHLQKERKGKTPDPDHEPTLVFAE